MKIIALLPIRNEAWVLEYTLTCLSGFCDVILISDQGSTDGSQEICRRFPKTVLLETPEGDDVDRLPRRARWRLLDAAREYDGNNLLWCTDADELISADAVRTFLAREQSSLAAPRAIACRYIHVWNDMGHYRHDLSQYGPSWKIAAIVDDRRVDYPRAADAYPLHEPRTPIDDATDVLKSEDLRLLHLQYALPRRNQMKQAWYRCLEFLDGRMSAAAINDKYSITHAGGRVRTKPIPGQWLQGIALPSDEVDDIPSWHDAEMLRLFDRHGIEFFEPLDIWYLPRLRQEFRRRTGRKPKPDRSYVPAFHTRVGRLGARMLAAVKRRVVP